MFFFFIACPFVGAKLDVKTLISKESESEPYLKQTDNGQGDILAEMKQQGGARRKSANRS